MKSKSAKPKSDSAFDDAFEAETDFVTPDAAPAEALAQPEAETAAADAFSESEPQTGEAEMAPALETPVEASPEHEPEAAGADQPADPFAALRALRKQDPDDPFVLHAAARSDDDQSGAAHDLTAEPAHDAEPAEPFEAPPPALGEAAADPFAGLPRTNSAPDPFAKADRASDPFAGLPSDHSHDSDFDQVQPAPAAHPIGEMLPGAELGEHSVPRITIHAFCARSELGELVQQASADRRMERAKTVVHEGGLSGAVSFYQNQPTPSLIIVESLDPTPTLLDLLGKLAEACDPGTKVIVVGAANDISLYRELIRRGVSEYLVPPFGPLQLIAAVTALYADPSQPFIGRQIAFCSAKGGAGASTLAHNVAHLIAERMSANTVLVDFDLAFGTAGLDFNQDPLHGILDALSQPDRLDPVLMERMMARCGDHLSLFTAPASVEKDFDISTETFEEVTQKIRSTSPYVVLDLPHAWTPWKRRMLVTSDDVVIVAEPDLASLRNAKNLIDLIRSARPNDAPPRVVLNKVGMPGRPEIPTKDFGEALGLAPAMVIAFDAKLFGQAANNGQMVDEVSPKSKPAESLETLARMISRRESGGEQATRPASIFDRLFRK